MSVDASYVYLLPNQTAPILKTIGQFENLVSLGKLYALSVELLWEMKYLFIIIQLINLLDNVTYVPLVNSIDAQISDEVQ